MEQLTDIINRINAELAVLPDKSYLLITPKALDDYTKRSISECVSVPVYYKVGVKHGTLITIAAMFKQTVSETPDILERGDHLNIQSTEDAEQLWPKICDLLCLDGYYKQWQLNNLVYDKGVVEEVQRRKYSETCIDPMDVKILANAYPTVEEFLKHI